MRPMLLIVTMAGGLLLACGTNSEAPQRSTSEIFYEASGSGEALVTYGNSSTGIKQETVVLPWSTYQAGRPTDGVTLRVRLSSSGLAQCKITVNGKGRVTNQAQGKNATVSCTTHG